MGNKMLSPAVYPIIGNQYLNGLMNTELIKNIIQKQEGKNEKKLLLGGNIRRKAETDVFQYKPLFSALFDLFKLCALIS